MIFLDAGGFRAGSGAESGSRVEWVGARRVLDGNFKPFRWTTESLSHLSFYVLLVLSVS